MKYPVSKYLIVILLFCSCRKNVDFTTYTLDNVTLSNIAFDRFLTADDFRYSKMRGFNLSLVQSYAELTAKNIPAARATGANVGRIWVRVKHDASNRYYFEKVTAPKAIDSACRVAEKVGMYMVLTVEFLPKQGADDWWNDSRRKTAIINFWRDSLATRYKDKTIIAAYDLMNEPRRNTKETRSKSATDAEYMAFQSDMVNAIRSVDTNHVIAIEVLENQMLARVKPLPQPNLIYSPHGYSPLYITHQGLSGTTREVYPQGSGYYTANYFPNVTYWRNPAEFQKKYNAAIWVGEFSCINWAPKNTYGEWTSTRWTEDCIKYMESLGWSWSYHAWREYQGWDAEIDPAWYLSQTFTNAKPASLPPLSARSTTAPTITMLRRWFTLN